MSVNQINYDFNQSRQFKRPNTQPKLGEVISAEYDIDGDSLENALSDQDYIEAKLGEILVAENIITNNQLSRSIAIQANLPFISLKPDPAQSSLASKYSATICVRFGCIPWQSQPGLLTIAIADPNNISWIKEAFETSSLKLKFVVARRAEIRKALIQCHGEALINQAERHCPRKQSCRALSPKSFIAISCLAIMIISYLVWADPAILLLATLGLLAIINIGQFSLKLSAFFAFLKKLGKSSLSKQRTNKKPAKLQKISLLIPIYKESKIVPHLIRRLKQLDYPTSLIDAKLLIEADDHLTRNAIEKIKLPTWMKPLIVPDHGTIKTKPKAMNFALPFCDGSIIGIYDAEDAPEANQLRKVSEYLSQAPENVACVQGYLDFFNPKTNWLSRVFTIDYAIWFRVVLQGFQQLKLPIPLGGTTVFFKKRHLIALGGWDAHNVTEDADLGMRLARHGYQCHFLDTTTYEEANTRPKSWVGQRSRWIKGYVMTWRVHMQSPIKLLQDLGLMGFMTFQITFIGSFINFLMAPMLLGFWLLSFGNELPESWQPNHGLWQVWFSFMILGLLTNLCIAVFSLRAKQHHHLIKWVPLMVLYWPLATIAAYKALFELFTKPTYWDKTTHGLNHEEA